MTYLGRRVGPAIDLGYSLREREAGDSGGEARRIGEIVKGKTNIRSSHLGFQKRRRAIDGKREGGVIDIYVIKEKLRRSDISESSKINAHSQDHQFQMQAMG